MSRLIKYHSFCPFETSVILPIKVVDLRYRPSFFIKTSITVLHPQPIRPNQSTTQKNFTKHIHHHPSPYSTRPLPTNLKPPLQKQNVSILHLLRQLLNSLHTLQRNFPPQSPKHAQHPFHPRHTIRRNQSNRHSHANNRKLLEILVYGGGYTSWC
jgi:hypothetical protein